jgi:hypothetical protein
MAVTTTSRNSPMPSPDLPPWQQFTSRRWEMRNIDQIRSLGSARRSGARALFRFANCVLRPASVSTKDR